MKKIYIVAALHKVYIISLLILALTTETRSQQLPVFNHYYLNQYLYNPAMVAHNGYAEVYFINRQQWRGIDGAPVTSSLTLQLPTKGNFSFGLNLYNDKYGVISSTGALITTAYTVHLTSESTLRGGLSIGMGRQSLDVAKLDDNNDVLAVSNYQGTSSYLDGNAGINYQWKNLNVGFVLPRVFQKEVVSAENFNKVKVGKLDYQLFLASYKFKVTPSVMVEPQFNYRVAKEIPNQFELLATAHYKEKIWIGGSYRQDYGSSIYIGGVINDIIKIGYAYELSSAQVAGFSNASHEIMVSVRLGKREVDKHASKTAEDNAVALREDDELDNDAESNEDIDNNRNTRLHGKSIENPSQPVDGKTKSQTISTTKSSTKNSTNDAPLVPKDNAVKATPTAKAPTLTMPVKPQQNNKSSALSETTKRTPDGKVITHDKPLIKDGVEKLKRKADSKLSLEIAQGHYVVVQAFRVYDNAVKYTNQLKRQGFAAECKFSSKSLFYYVYFAKPDNIEDGKAQRNIIRQQAQFNDAWLLSIEE